jgi:hypothetical protein
MMQYQVLDVHRDKLQKLLNREAAKGWRPISVEQFINDENGYRGYTVVFEREVCATSSPSSS